MGPLFLFFSCGFPSAAMYAGLIMSKSIQVHCQTATMNMIVPQVLPIMTNLVLWVAGSAGSSEELENDHRMEGISSGPVVCEEADGLIE